jgi:hypothetical protein
MRGGAIKGDFQTLRIVSTPWVILRLRVSGRSLEMG